MSNFYFSHCTSTKVCGSIATYPPFFFQSLHYDVPWFWIGYDQKLWSLGWQLKFGQHLSTHYLKNKLYIIFF